MIKVLHLTAKFWWHERPLEVVSLSTAIPASQGPVNGREHILMGRESEVGLLGMQFPGAFCFGRQFDSSTRAWTITFWCCRWSRWCQSSGCRLSTRVINLFDWVSGREHKECYWKQKEIDCDLAKDVEIEGEQVLHLLSILVLWMLQPRIDVRCRH